MDRPTGAPKRDRLPDTAWPNHRRGGRCMTNKVLPAAPKPGETGDIEMQPFRTFKFHTSLLTLGIAGAVLAAATPGFAQEEPLPELPQLPPVGGAQAGQTPMSPADLEALPPEYRELPAASETTSTTVGEDGVETITRTRRITATGPVQTQQMQYQQSGGATSGYAPLAYAPAPVVFDRAQWLAECRRRTEGLSRKERARLIGGLIGAIGGGIIGNSVADGNRLGGTLLGAGVGGAAGVLAGNAIAGGRDRDDYDCEEVLQSYLAQPSVVYADPSRIASRVIPAPGYAYQGYAAPQYGSSYGYAPTYPAYDYGYVQQQTVLVPVQTMQQQRVLVRETVREEMVPAVRSIPRPVEEPIRYREPTPIKGAGPRMIKN